MKRALVLDHTTSELAAEVTTDTTASTRGAIVLPGPSSAAASASPRVAIAAGRTRLEVVVDGWRFEFDVPAEPSRAVSFTILAGGLTLAALMALASVLMVRHERGLIVARQQTARERDLAAALALAVTRAQVLSTTALMVPNVAMARGVSVGLLDRGQLRMQHSPNVHSRVTERWASMDVAMPTPITDCARSGETLVFGTRDDVVRRYPDVHFDAEFGAAALACVPLVIRQEPVGALAFGYAREQPFDADQVRWLNQLAAMVSGALERARLHDGPGEH